MATTARQPGDCLRGSLAQPWRRSGHATLNKSTSRWCCALHPRYPGGRQQGRRRWADVAASQQQQQQSQQQNPSQQETKEFPNFQLPKFQPFTPQNALQRAMTAYRHWHDCPADGADAGSSLLIQPLTADWVNDTADLLTDSFAESMSALRYTSYLRRQVRKYLEAHMLLPPKAVVLVALLLPAGHSGALQCFQQQQERQQERESEQHPGLGTWLTPDVSVKSTFSTGTSSSGGMGATAGSSPAQGQQMEQIEHKIQQSAQLAPAEPHQQAGQTPELLAVSSGSGGAQLVGVTEVSFSASTRSKYLTLNPPEDRPYLCNMAIHHEYRGRGYGSVLLAAAEALVGQLGETEMYLHLRVQDMPAAALYSKAGYEQVACDSFLVRFLALDQRRLMKKCLKQQQQQQEQQQQAAAQQAQAPPLQ